MTKHYDLIIIGAGTGNSIPQPQFDDKRIAIVEKAKFGGTCMNAGCIPTKMLVHAADQAYSAVHSSKLGIDATLNGVDWPAIQQRIFADRIDLIAEGGEKYRREDCDNIDVYSHAATFVGPRTIKTGDGDSEVTISADQVLIAAGARPHIPEAIEKSGVPYHTSDNVMRIPALPRRMVIIGGGYIATEFAHVFSSFGVQVTVLVRSEAMLRELDADVTQAFSEIAANQWDVRFNTEVTAAESHDDGTMTLTLTDGSTLLCDELLVSTGRTPNGDQLNLSAAGIDMDGSRIAVDEYGRTSAEGVWALGDVSSPFELKHVANAEGRAVFHNLLNPDDLQPMPHKFVPAAVFTHPQIAAVGLTEQAAIDAGHDITVKVQKYGDIAYGWAMEDPTGFCKVIADRKTGKLLGAHIMGPEASSLIQTFITMLSFDMDCREVATEQYWIHPALPELVENALLGLEF